MTMKERIWWCERHAGPDMAEVIALFRLSPDTTGMKIMRILWDAATGDRGEDPNQSIENVDRFYERFPSLPILRPLLSCAAPECVGKIWGVTINYVEFCRHRIMHHRENAGQIADILEGLGRK